MLETVKTMIVETEKPFDIFYHEYIEEVQDASIESELSHISSAASTNSSSVVQCMNDIERGLRDEFFKRG